MVLDHVFILVAPEGKIADELVDLGLKESFSRKHPGQGTSNRRFEFSNGMLEFLWVHDASEANTGPGKNLNFPGRSLNEKASPFGLVFSRCAGSNGALPYDGWSYQPDFFEPPNAFHIGSNSGNLDEPLCIYGPFEQSALKQSVNHNFDIISHCKITTTAKIFSPVLDVVSSVSGLSVVSGNTHLMELHLDNDQLGLSRDFRPALPLILYW